MLFVLLLSLEANFPKGLFATWFVKKRTTSSTVVASTVSSLLSVKAFFGESSTVSGINWSIVLPLVGSPI